MNKKSGKWMGIGIGVGTAIGVALDDIALWIAIGAAFGFVMTNLPTFKFNNKD